MATTHHTVIDNQYFTELECQEINASRVNITKAMKILKTKGKGTHMRLLEATIESILRSLICMHKSKGCRPEGDCIHIRQITSACITTVMYVTFLGC